MALPAGVAFVTNIKGPKGPTGSLAFATAETAPWNEGPDVIMVGPEENRGAHFKIPLPMPGPELLAVRDEAVAARDQAEMFAAGTGELQDAAVATLLATDGYTTNRYVRDRYVRKVTYRDLPTSNIWIGHHAGGDRSYGSAPTNSLAAWEYTIALGAQLIDLDVRETLDGVLVVHHDPTTEWTSTDNVVIADTLYAHLPLLQQKRFVGGGWEAERIVTLEEVFRALGGRVLIDIELKGGSHLLGPVAALVQKYGLEGSVYLNYDATGVAFTPGVLDAGLLPHMYRCDTVAKIDAAIDAGALLIDIPHNAASVVVDAAERIVTDNGGRFIAHLAGVDPIFGLFMRDHYDAMDPRIQGYWASVPGYLGRGDAPLADSIAGPVRSGKISPGWSPRDASNLTTPDAWLTRSGIVLSEDGGNMNILFRDLGGTPKSLGGQITWRVKFPQMPTWRGDSVVVRVLSESDNARSNALSDQAHGGYRIAFRANGDLELWSINPTTNAAESLATTSDPDCVAGTQYDIKFEWTETAMRVTRLDTGTTTGWVTDSRWRGAYVSAYGSMNSGKGVLVSLARTWA